MGFLGFFRKEREQRVTEKPPEEISRVGVKEIESWFERSFRDSIDKSKSRGNGLYQGVMESFSAIKDSLGILEAARFSGRERIHMAANMIKESYVRRAYPALAGIEKASRGIDMSYSGLNDFATEASRTLDNLKSTTPKQAVLMSRYFKRESDPVVTRIKEAGENVNALKSWLQEDMFLRMADDVKKKSREQSSLEEELNSLEGRREELRKEAKALKEKKEKKEAEFLDLLKGKEWQDFNRLTREIKDVKSEILKIEYELTNELSPMKRPLKKLEHMLRQQDLLFNHKGFLRSFLQDPFGAVKTRNGEESLRKFLFTMNKMMHDNKIELKEKEMEKLDSLMERMVREIPEAKKRYVQLTEKRDHMEKTLKESAIINRKQELEGEVEKFSRYISEMEKEVKDIAKEQETLRERIEAERKELEKLILKGTGREVDIVG